MVFLLKNQNLRSLIFFDSLRLVISGRETLPQWDKQIQSLCYQVNSIIESISKSHPEWMLKAMDEQMVS